MKTLFGLRLDGDAISGHPARKQCAKYVDTFALSGITLAFIRPGLVDNSLVERFIAAWGKPEPARIQFAHGGSGLGEEAG